MATDHSSEAKVPGGSKPLEVAMDASAGNTEKVTAPAWARSCDVQFFAADRSTGEAGKIAASGTDGGAIGNDIVIVPSGGIYGYPLSAGRGRNLGGTVFYLAGSSNSGFAKITYHSIV